MYEKIPRKWLRLHQRDNVAVALTPLAPDDIVEGVPVREDIPVGHKVALKPIAAGDGVVKYANLIAVASAPIAPGCLVHIHNAVMPNFVDQRQSERLSISTAQTAQTRMFNGIRRLDGGIATRNYVGILTTVNCSATVARAIAERYRGPTLNAWPGVDGVIALTHAHGCAMNRGSEGIRILRRTLAGYARHPNFGGVLILGLGCESNELAPLLEASGGGDRIRSLNIQTTGGTRESIEVGAREIEALLDQAQGISREPLPVSGLSLGLQCGGSDGFSGISANPALGEAADLLVAHGGTAILSETPEIYGAEHLLVARANSDAVADELEARVRWWYEHVKASGATLNDNPSSGNIAGGITTILEKSLGAVSKAGVSPLSAVYDYAQFIDSHGLVFMDSPGFDPMSVTGQVASGANLIAFTTGRGSTFGCKPVPSLKLATNSPLYRRMRDDMDINCGDIVEGSMTIKEKGREIFEALIALAGGAPSASERLGFGEAEFAPWVPGAVT
jgi:altronate hydrolase